MRARWAPRRLLSRSPHALEVNDQAFRRARDIMIGAAVDFQAKVAGMLVERGHSAKRIEKILGANLMRVFGETWKA